ncbi:hypothetical protein [Thermomonospora umbrina]|uniref:Uncharacterized protein n=1 Tax=Thermomonospora umbrina TaxID=111806 RepID=A0A3D9T132_9ACTN|nr:hypothetical protein [Thermomonospora umbrina]REF00044.1 hypothetical protein DFJ69_5566 [Thermomonospora umbrina]
MFEIWESGEPARFVSDADTLKGALDKVDTMCRLRHDQAAADLERPEDGYHFEIRDEGGASLAFLDYVPDPSRPYQSVIVQELLRLESP